jgi:hypothetical protein
MCPNQSDLWLPKPNATPTAASLVECDTKNAKVLWQTEALATPVLILIV